jgi:hypothetical protein
MKVKNKVRSSITKIEKDAIKYSFPTSKPTTPAEIKLKDEMTAIKKKGMFIHIPHD